MSLVPIAVYERAEGTRARYTPCSVCVIRNKVEDELDVRRAGLNVSAHTK